MSRMNADVRARLHQSRRWFQSLERPHRFGAGALFGICGGIAIETFMVKSGFYDISAVINARRRYQMQEHRAELDKHLEEVKFNFFKSQLEHRREIRRALGESEYDDDVGKAPQSPEEIPSLYQLIRDKIYPPMKGEDRVWGPWDAEGKPRH
eukprot:TRINITY_DN60391_c0_g1_i1.p1 TRINITY_DN60391_c0_g1~~TRINITY_DN60391_c0_g1_i1.p1  ORF type:complete len:178 (+),score=66.36 TRINITY_DN60391_c0_g1_i1:79-534(+)